MSSLSTGCDTERVSLLRTLAVCFELKDDTVDLLLFASVTAADFLVAAAGLFPVLVFPLEDEFDEARKDAPLRGWPLPLDDCDEDWLTACLERLLFA